MKHLTFTAKGTFEALDRAQSYLNQNGFSYGSLDGDRSVAILRGDYTIHQKWHNLSADDIKSIHGTMRGNFREGPVTVGITIDYEEKVTQAQIEAQFYGCLNSAAAERSTREAKQFTGVGFKPVRKADHSAEVRNMVPEQPCSALYPLFKHMSDNHNLTLLDGEMDEIVRVVLKMVEDKVAKEFGKPAPYQKVCSRCGTTASGCIC